ncbi:velvet factor-domain-containing protein [Thelephora terrestris]|uniref:Velvet factor-domain-containing protein n=1 Tax=Thelephora terrestris TaxID=56493 RepID=A0A9P6HG55_9AGAM|nr:velvet factor-domain-containing protein [Thelephora terrestris]
MRARAVLSSPGLPLHFLVVGYIAKPFLFAANHPRNPRLRSPCPYCKPPPPSMDDDVQQFEGRALPRVNRDRLWEPKQARMCGVGNDRRPIDPPPIVQLRVIERGATDPTPSRSSSPDSGGNQCGSSYYQSPYYFMYASLAQPEEDVEIHWFNGGKTRCTAGSVVSSLYHLKDSENRGEDAAFFVFPDLSVRMEGSYRLKLSLFEVAGTAVRFCKSVFSAPFYVYTAKKFPGMEESTQLSCTMADQGIKIRIRKDIRTRRRPLVPAPPQVIGPIEASPTIGHASQKAEDEPKEKKGRGIRIVRETKRQKIEKIGEIPPDACDNVAEPGILPHWPGTRASAPVPAPTPTIPPSPQTSPPAQNQQPQPQQQVSPVSPTQPPSDHTQYDHRGGYPYEHTAPPQQPPPAHHYNNPQAGPPATYGPPPPHYQYGNYGPPQSGWSQPGGYDHYQPPPLHYPPPQHQPTHHQHPPAPAPASAPAPAPGTLPPPSHHPSHGHPPPPASYRPPPADYSYHPPSNAQTYNAYEHHYTYPPPPMPSQHPYPQQNGYNGSGLPPPQPAPAQSHPNQDVRTQQPPQTQARAHYPPPAPGYNHPTPPAPHSYDLPPVQHHQSQAQHHPQPHHQPQPHQQPQPQPQHLQAQQYRHYTHPPPSTGYAPYNSNPGDAWGVPNSSGYVGHAQGGSGALPLPPPSSGYQQHPQTQAHDGSMGGPGMRGGDRIQLAPLRATQGSPPPTGPPSAISVHSNGSGGDGSVSGRGPHVEGRRNPLSIGNIIDGSH